MRNSIIHSTVNRFWITFKYHKYKNVNYLDRNSSVEQLKCNSPASWLRKKKRGNRFYRLCSNGNSNCVIWNTASLTRKALLHKLEWLPLLICNWAFKAGSEVRGFVTDTIRTNTTIVKLKPSPDWLCMSLQTASLCQSINIFVLHWKHIVLII